MESASPSPAPAPEDLWNQLGPRVCDKVIVEGREFLLERPSESDRLMDLPAVHQAFAKDEYLPYWTDLWPAARMLAKVIARETWVAGTEALELGCGLGLPGIVALSRGLKVTFTDYDQCALRFAADNAKLNGLHDFKCLQLDWRYPPEGMLIPVILAGDLVYETRNLAPIAAFVKKCLHPQGVCLLTDPDRIPAQTLREVLTDTGLRFTTSIVRAGEPNGRRLKGTLYRITL